MMERTLGKKEVKMVGLRKIDISSNQKVQWLKVIIVPPKYLYRSPKR